MSEYAIFEVYIAQNYTDITEGKEIVCEVLAREEGVTKSVKARIAKTKEELDGADLLLVKRESGEWKDEKWYIQVVEELDPVDVVLPTAPLATAPPIYGVGK